MQIGSTHPVHGHEAAHGQTAAKAAGDSAHSQQSQAVPGGEAAEAVAGKDRSEQEEKHVVTMMAEALEASSGKLLLFGTKKTTSGFKSPTDKPKDTSSQLTQRLVGAKGQFEVRQVIASASSELVKLRIAAAGCKGKEAEAVRSYIRKLERLISRAGSKIKDLDKEDMMEIQKARAQKKQQLRRVEEIKAELRKKRVGRRAKENSYLIEGMHDRIFGRQEYDDYADPAYMDVASEAQIDAQAVVMAAAEAMAAGGAEGGVTMEAGAGGGIGGEAAGAPAEGGIDISL